MKNEFGESLDRNGYAPSIVGNCGGSFVIGDSDCVGCAICGRTDGKLSRHEAMHGPYRTKSKNLGLWILVCDGCHNRIHHKNDGLDLKVKVAVQKRAMAYYGWTTDDFRQRFGKSYV